MADIISPMNNAAGSSHSNEGVIGANFLAAVSENRGEDALRILQAADSDLILIADLTEHSALHIAAKDGLFDTVRQLISFLQLENEQNNNMRLLKEAATQQNSHGDTALHLAIRNNHLDVARLLFVACPQARRKINNYVEFVWCKAQALLTEEELEKERAASSAFHSGTPQHSSFSDIEMDIMRTNLLRDEGRVKDLIRAARRSPVDSVMRILSANPDLIRLGQTEKDTRMTVLHVAAANGRVELLRELVQFMINNKQSSLMITKDRDCGDTALHLAIQNRHKEAAIYLIGVAPEAAFHPNTEGATALHLALQGGHGDLITQVFKFMPGSSIPKSLKESMLKDKKKSLVHAIVGARNLDVFTKVLKELPEYIHVSNYKGWKPLSYAAYNGYLEGVSYILENYPHASKEFDADGSLPIHKAVGGGHLRILLAFLSNRPQAIHDVDRKGRSILHFAVMYTKADILFYLTNQIREIEKIYGYKNHEGKTFVDLAKELSTN